VGLASGGCARVSAGQPPAPQFPRRFIEELEEILGSESVSGRYDRSTGELTETRGPFLENWQLGSVAFEPGSDRRRVVVTLRGGGRAVEAVLDADDFLDFLRGEAHIDFNKTGYSDLAYFVSILFMEQFMGLDPSRVTARRIRVRHPPDPLQDQ
jgi:hypothetical protein